MKLQLHPNEATRQVAVLSDIDYSSITVAELKLYAKDKGITGYSSMTKAELIEAVQ